MDLVSTILDFYGIQIPSVVQGMSMKGILTGERRDHKDAAITEHFDNYGNRSSSVRTERFRYFYSFSGEEKLFDLVTEPYEIDNVVNESEYSEALSEMRKVMIEKCFKAGFYVYQKPAQY